MSREFSSIASPRQRCFPFCALLLVFSSLLPLRIEAQSSSAAPSLTIAAVQYEVDPESYVSTGAFFESIEPWVRRASRANADLVVFPEYINVFLAFHEEVPELLKAQSMEEGMEVVRANVPDGTSIHDVLRSRAAGLGRRMSEVWGKLARRYSLHILAGSYFAAEGRELYNRAVVYGPSGSVEYEQEKVYLTPFERDFLGLSPGRIGDSRLFELEGWDCAVTICRDSFFDEWNRRYEEADLWIEIKANGEVYEEETQELFERALPERIGETGVPYGLTVSLTGAFLDFFWEGTTFVVRSEVGGEWEYVERIEDPRSPRLLVEELRLAGDIEGR